MNRDGDVLVAYRGQSVLASSFPVLSSASLVRRLHMLAAELSISPSELRRYAMGASGCGGDQGKKKESGNADGVANGEVDRCICDAVDEPMSEQQPSKCAVDVCFLCSNSVEELPPFLRAILTALVLPFVVRGDDGCRAERSADTTAKSNGGKVPSDDEHAKTQSATISPDQGQKGTSSTGAWVSTPSAIAESLAAPFLATSVGDRTVSCTSTPAAVCSAADNNKSDGNGNVSSSFSARDSTPRESSDVRAANELRSSGNVEFTLSPRGIEADSGQRVCDLGRSDISGQKAVPLSDVLSLKQFMVPLLSTDASLPIQWDPVPVSGGMGKHVTGQLEHSLKLLPQALRAPSGVRRLSDIYPPFVPLLLELFLGYSVQDGIKTFPIRFVLLRLLELCAPTLVSLQLSRHDEDVDDTVDMEGREGGLACPAKERDALLHVARHARERLIATLLSLFDSLEDSAWAFTLGGYSVMTQLVPPSYLSTRISRHAAHVANSPKFWSPAVALAWCAVIHEHLSPTALMEEGHYLCKQEKDNQESTFEATEDQGDQIAGVAAAMEALVGSSTPTEEELARAGRALGAGHRNMSSILAAPLSRLLNSAKSSFVQPLVTVDSVASSSSISSETVPSMKSQDLPSETATPAVATAIFVSGEQNDGDFIPLTEAQWQMIAKTPPPATLSAAVVVTCMILSAGALSKRTVLALGRWCLHMLDTPYANPCAVGLTHLMFKYPRFMREAAVSIPLVAPHKCKIVPYTSVAPSYAVPHIANATTTVAGGSGGNAGATITLININNVFPTSGKLYDAAFMLGCRLASAALRHQAMIAVQGHMGEVCGACSAGRTEYLQRCQRMLYELQDTQCYLLMLFQASVLRESTSLTVEMQDELVTLFVICAHLRVTIAPVNGYDMLQPRKSEREDPGTVHNDRLFDLIVGVVDDSFRIVTRTLDIVLHNYKACSPQRVYAALASLLPPKNILFDELRRVGVWARHSDCLETIYAAAEWYHSAHGAASRQPHRDDATGDSLVTGNKPENGGQRAAPSPASSDCKFSGYAVPLTHKEISRMLEGALSAAEAKRGESNTQRDSLIGILPSSGEIPRFSVAVSGSGFTATHRRWWMRRTVAYLFEQWWRCRVGLVAECPTRSLFANEETDNDFALHVDKSSAIH
ncbi:hypothetical protein TRVL_01147 [Trypanosoma vivax]|nr:hypothetical protein TRVL_01147 [Trypanosoma vivax]